MRFDTTAREGLEALLTVVAATDGAVVEPLRFTADIKRLCGAGAGPLPVAVQLRRSHGVRHQEGSLRDQLAPAVERLLREGGRRLVRVYVHEALSGALLGKKKGALDEVVADAEAGVFKEFWTKNTNRFSRQKFTEKAFWRHLIDRAGVTRRYLELDVSVRGGEILEVVHDLRDHEELIEKSERSVERLYARHNERGVRMGTTPYGWAIQIQDENGKPVRVIPRTTRYEKSPKDRAIPVPGVPAEVENVRSMFRWTVEEKLGALAIAHRLNTSAVLSPRGSDWNSSSVRALIRNPIHAGGLSMFKTSHAMFKKLERGKVVDVKRPGEINRARVPRSDWIIKWGTHEGIVDRDTWERAQRELDARAAKQTNQHSLRPGRRLTPKATCENCGSPMDLAGPSWKAPALLCRAYHFRGVAGCSARQVPDRALATVAWHAVQNELRELLGTTDLGAKVRNRVRALLAARVAEKPQVDVAAARQRLRDIEQRVRTISEMLSPESAALFDRELKRLAVEKAQLDATIEEAKQPRASVDLERSVERAMAILERLSRPLDEAPLEEARAVIAAGCRQVRCRFEPLAGVRQHGRPRSRLERVTVEVVDPRDLLGVSELVRPPGRHAPFAGPGREGGLTSESVRERRRVR